MDRDVRRAFASLWARFHVEQLQLQEGGGVFDWPMAEPLELLVFLVEGSSFLQDIYESAIEKFPPERCTWSLIVAWDEFTPGNKLTLDNTKKSMVLSFTFKELGIEALQLDYTWISPVVVRSQNVKLVVGGWSHMLALFLRRILLGPSGLATTGVVLTIHKKSVLINAKVTNLLSDGEGLQIALDWRGASSWTPCPRHMNVLKKFDEGDHPADGFVDICCSNPKDMKVRDAAGLAEAADLVRVAHEQMQAGRISEGELKMVETANGLNFNPHGLLWDMVLRGLVLVGNVITLDWVHSALQDGALLVELFAVIMALGRSMADLEQFLKQWEFPSMLRRRGQQLWRIFSHWRTSEDSGKIRCTAGELLTLYTLARHYVELHAQPGAMEKELKSFKYICKAVDIIMQAKFGIIPPETAAKKLERALTKYMKAHRAAYGNGLIKPKHHWMFDLILQILRDGMVLDAFVVERNHLNVKLTAARIDNLASLPPPPSAIYHQLNYLSGACHC